MIDNKKKVRIRKKQEEKPKCWILISFVALVVVVIAVVLFDFPIRKNQSVQPGKASIEQSVSVPQDQTTDGTQAKTTPSTTVDTTATTPTSTPSSVSTSGNTQSSQSSAGPATATSEPASGNAQSSQPSARPARGNTSPLQGSLDEKARRVIRGDFGNGRVGKQKLGSEYQAIQRRVNEIYRRGRIK